LPEGSQFCVACGFYNEGAVAERVVDIANKVESRLMWFKLFNTLATIFPFLRVFLR
jgi:hypothetical protein